MEFNQRRSWRGWAAVGAVALAAAGEAAAQATEGASAVEVGGWRLDSDLATWTDDRRLPASAGAGRVRSWSTGQVQVATGLAEGWEGRAYFQGWHREVSDGAARSGAGDVALALKRVLAGDESCGPAWAALAEVKLPTGDGRFSDDTTDAAVSLVHGRPAGAAGFFNAQLGLDDHGDGAGGRDLGAWMSAVIGTAGPAGAALYAEAAASVYPITGDAGEAAAEVGAGASRALRADGAAGLDAAIYAGVTREAADLRVVLRAWIEWGR